MIELIVFAVHKNENGDIKGFGVAEHDLKSNLCGNITYLPYKRLFVELLKTDIYVGVWDYISKKWQISALLNPVGEEIVVRTLANNKAVETLDNLPTFLLPD